MTEHTELSKARSLFPLHHSLVARIVSSKMPEESATSSWDFPKWLTIALESVPTPLLLPKQDSSV